jgi:hypothetical protein
MPFKIGYGELDRQIDDMGGPGNLGIDGTAPHTKKSRPVLLLICERQPITGDLPHDFLGDASHRWQYRPGKAAKMAEQPHYYRLPQVHESPLLISDVHSDTAAQTHSKHLVMMEIMVVGAAL